MVDYLLENNFARVAITTECLEAILLRTNNERVLRSTFMV